VFFSEHSVICII